MAAGSHLPPCALHENNSPFNGELSLPPWPSSSRRTAALDTGGDGVSFLETSPLLKPSVSFLQGSPTRRRPPDDHEGRQPISKAATENSDGLRR